MKMPAVGRRSRSLQSDRSGSPEKPGRMPVSLIALLIGCLAAYLLMQYLPPDWISMTWLSSKRSDTMGTVAPARPGAMPDAAQSGARPEPVPVLTAMGDFTGLFEEAPDTPEASEGGLRLPAIRIIGPAVRFPRQQPETLPGLH